MKFIRRHWKNLNFIKQMNLSDKTILSWKLLEQWQIMLLSNKSLKVARVVNLKLAFTDWFCYNLIVPIKLCKIRNLNLDKTVLFLTNQVISLKNWKLRRFPTTIKFIIFCWNFAHVSYLAMSTKGCSEFFFILFKSWNINKNVKNECVETRFFSFLHIT